VVNAVHSVYRNGYDVGMWFGFSLFYEAEKACECAVASVHLLLLEPTSVHRALRSLAYPVAETKEVDKDRQEGRYREPSFGFNNVELL